ncbi:hypothetical protein D3C85_992670 [compost metagenome]
MAVADASFRMSIEAISLGGIWFNKSMFPWRPSTTTKGSLPPIKEDIPRILTLGVEPGSLPVCVMLTPADFPEINCNGFTIAP